MGLVYNKFNRGEIDDLLLAREDVNRVSDSAGIHEQLHSFTYGADDL